MTCSRSIPNELPLRTTNTHEPQKAEHKNRTSENPFPFLYLNLNSELIKPMKNQKQNTKIEVFSANNTYKNEKGKKKLRKNKIEK